MLIQGKSLNAETLTDVTQKATSDARKQFAEAFDLLRPLPAREGTMHIYVFVPKVAPDRPIGGVKMLYRHVDVLNKHGFSASIILHEGDTRNKWFHSDTPIRFLKDRFITKSDILVLPEILGPLLAEYGKGVSKVIYNQSAYLSFLGYPLLGIEHPSPYRNDEVVATIVCSENSREYLQYTFPGLTLFRIRHSIDSHTFTYNPVKKKQVCFMPRKSREDLTQVINILRGRGSLTGYEVIPIDRVSHEVMVQVMRDSLIFLSGGTAEGFGLPPAEAMACGCIVIGYHGGGGREYFHPDWCYPIEAGDVVTFARTVENVIHLNEVAPYELYRKGIQAASFIRDNYTENREESDIVETWNSIISRHSIRSPKLGK